MLIEEKIVKHWIDNFYGYGSWQARTWFIGYEESGGDLPEEVAEKINYFYQAHPASNEGALCDIRELYRRLTVKFEGPIYDPIPISMNTGSVRVQYKIIYGRIFPPLNMVLETSQFLTCWNTRNTSLPLHPCLMNH
jgi:hypothetical protein